MKRGVDPARVLRLLRVVLAFAVWSAGGTMANAALVSGVQTGTATSTANGTLTVAITNVDPTRSFLIFQVRSNSPRPVASYLRGRIASATSLEFVRVTDEAAPATMNILWYVVSFASGVTVQRGETTQGTTPMNVPITAVAAVNQAFVTWSKTADPPDQTWGVNDPVLGELTSTTNLQFRVGGTNPAHVIGWQVIEFTNPADINVQKGTITTMTGTTTTVTATLGTPVDVNRTFVLVGFRSDGSSAAVGRRLLRAQLTDATTITIDRSIAAAGDDLPEITWQAIELRDGSSVQRGSENFPSATAQRTVTLATPVDPNRAIAFASVQPSGGQSMGRSPYAADDVIGVGSATLSLSATQLIMDRNNTAAAADFGWFVVHFKSRRVAIID